MWVLKYKYLILLIIRPNEGQASRQLVFLLLTRNLFCITLLLPLALLLLAQLGVRLFIRLRNLDPLRFFRDSRFLDCLFYDFLLALDGNGHEQAGFFFISHGKSYL